MKIVAPLTNINSYEPLVKAGADEFFCGIVPFDWLEEYSNVMPLNRRETLIISYNIGSMSSMRILRKKIEKYGVPVKITLNSHYYLVEQYPIILRTIQKLMTIGFDTFILADIGLIHYLRKQGVKCKIHLSGELEIVNSTTMKFLDQFDVERYVFPRKITLENIRNCIQHNNLTGKEYEAFIMNAYCLYSGAFCNSVHCDEFVSACNIPNHIIRYRKENQTFSKIERHHKLITKVREKNREQLVEASPEYSFGMDGCGVCRILELINIGVTHLKVVGRGYAVETLGKDISNLRKIINLAYKEKENEAFIQCVKEQFLNNKCPEVCYYP